MRSILKPVCAAAAYVRKPFAIALLTTVAVISTANQGWSALIAYDGFNYSPVGSDVSGNSGGGSFGFSGAWLTTTLNDQEWDIGGGSLNDFSGQLDTTGNRVTGNQFFANRDLGRNLASPLGVSGTTAYFSFLVRPEVELLGIDGWFAFVLRGGADVHVGRGSFGTVYGVQGSPTDIHAEVDVTRLMVLRADFADGNDTYSLYIDPLPGAAEPAVADAVLSWDAGTITRVDFTGPGAVSFDELRIGETFGDVTPSSVVPEPSTYAMAAIGLFGLLAYRRFR